MDKGDLVRSAISNKRCERDEVRECGRDHPRTMVPYRLVLSAVRKSSAAALDVVVPWEKPMSKEGQIPTKDRGGGAEVN